MRALMPDSIRKPFAKYSHAIETAPGCRIVAISGQLGVRPDDTTPEDAEAQAAQCFANIDAILKEAQMDRRAVIRINAYVTDRAFMTGYMMARDAWTSGLTLPPASTLMIVSGFTRPEFKVEIEALAAAPPRSEMAGLTE